MILFRRNLSWVAKANLSHLGCSVGTNRVAHPKSFNFQIIIRYCIHVPIGTFGGEKETV